MWRILAALQNTNLKLTWYKSKEEIDILDKHQRDDINRGLSCVK